MQILAGSLVYKLIYRISVYYRTSTLEKVVSYIVTAYRNSVLGKWVKSLVERESSVEYSVVVRILKRLLKRVDQWMLALSRTFSRWSESSLIISAYRGVAKLSAEKLFVLVLPVFGIGYLIGRAIFGSIMIRDILFLGLIFIIAAVLMTDPEKRKTMIKSSRVYEFYRMILE